MTVRRTPKIWLNVTTSSRWRRPAVGVVRLEVMLAEELPKLLPADRFGLCVWEGDRFVPWLATDCPPPTARPASPGRGEELIYAALPLREAVVAIIQGSLSLLPRPLRPPVSRGLRRVRTFMEGMLAAARRFRSPPHIALPRQATNDERCEIGCLGRGDVLISAGLDWDPTYSRAFGTLRYRHGVSLLTCCYDLIPLLFPQYVVSDVAAKFAGYFIDLAEASATILCISCRSEQDLRAFLERTGARPVPTRVIPLGDNVPGSLGEVSREIEELAGERFILFVSTIERRKNHEVLYRAYHLLCRNGSAASLPQLVFVGMPGWGVTDLLKDIELDPLTQGRIRFLDRASDRELALLYGKALFCVYPSLYEGWGLPVGEALAMGKPVLASACGSLPEVGGDLVRYLDPWNAREWADAIHEWSTNDRLLADVAANIRAHYTPRTWTKSAEAVIAVIDDIVASSDDTCPPA